MTSTYSKLHDNLDKLIEKYKNNEYIFGRLTNYMENLLPTILENELLTYNERESRKKELTNNRDEFVHRFLHKNKYYYAPQTELFINYDGQHFNSYNEDDILHQILSTISYEQCLKPWKYKIKLNIMKQIRERSPLDAIPESSTIQYVINSLYPSLFSSKNQVKYFLTMLGDCLLNKPESNNLIYIMKPNSKELIREFSNQCYYYFGISNGFNNIKFKYYGHDYNLCRLIDMNVNTNNQFKKTIPIPSEMEKHILDFICVAAHYSKRYGCADNFLQECSDSEMVDHILYLNKTNPDTIVKQFIKTNIKTQCNNSKLNFKNMIFLWKKYIEDCNIPNVIFYDNLKNILKQHLKYDEDSNNFLDVTSVNLPLISSFLKFWETNIVEENIFSIDDNDDMESSTTSNNSLNNIDGCSYDICSAYELEIDELCSLFKKYNGKGTQANDNFILELIRHFYPDQYIENDKYLLHIRCSMWDKKGEIIKALELFKQKYYINNKTIQISSPIPKSIEDAYEFYSKQKNILIASKNYFERVAKEIIGSHLDDGLISNTWGKGT